MPRLPSLGALVTTEVESHELGTFDGRRLVGHTQRRTLRLAVGDRTALRWSLTRLRPTSIEVEEPGRTYEVPVNVPPDPLLWPASRIAALTAGAAATRIVASAVSSRLARDASKTSKRGGAR